MKAFYIKCIVKFLGLPYFFIERFILRNHQPHICLSMFAIWNHLFRRNHKLLFDPSDEIFLLNPLLRNSYQISLIIAIGIEHFMLLKTQFQLGRVIYLRILLILPQRRWEIDPWFLILYFFDVGFISCTSFVLSIQRGWCVSSLLSRVYMSLRSRFRANKL